MTRVHQRHAHLLQLSEQGGVHGQIKIAQAEASQIGFDAARQEYGQAVFQSQADVGRYQFRDHGRIHVRVEMRHVDARSQRPLDLGPQLRLCGRDIEMAAHLRNVTPETAFFIEQPGRAFRLSRAAATDSTATRWST